jgi:repressor LexA
LTAVTCEGLVVSIEENDKMVMASVPGTAGAPDQLPPSQLSLDEMRARAAMVGPLGHPSAEEGPTNAALRKSVLVPLIGQVAAGRLTLADQMFEDFFVLPRQVVGEGALFLLQVRGDSMINAAIADGDLVVVREQPAAENGEVVAAMIEGEATIKTYKKSSGNIWLMPENPDYQPIPGEKATVLGKVVAVIRRL